MFHGNDEYYDDDDNNNDDVNDDDGYNIVDKDANTCL